MQYETSSCGIDLKFNGPDTVEEYDKKANAVGACLKDAVGGCIAWDTLPEWMEAFRKFLVEKTGIQRQVDTAATEKAKARAETEEAKAKVKDVYEKDAGFIKKLRAQAAAGGLTLTDGSSLDKAGFDAAGQAVADGISIDPAPSKRQGAPKKEFLEKAKEVIARPVDAREASISKMLAVVEFDLERDAENVPDETSLARLVGKFTDYLRSQV